LLLANAPCSITDFTYLELGSPQSSKMHTDTLWQLKAQSAGRM
jgi:hypothetical protein